MLFSYEILIILINIYQTLTVLYSVVSLNDSLMLLLKQWPVDYQLFQLIAKLVRKKY